jgi:hypothetical protein
MIFTRKSMSTLIIKKNVKFFFYTLQSWAETPNKPDLDHVKARAKQTEIVVAALLIKPKQQHGKNQNKYTSLFR